MSGYLYFLHLIAFDGNKKYKIGNRGNCEESGETPKETVETPGVTCGNILGNGRKQLGNRKNLTLRNNFDNHGDLSSRNKTAKCISPKCIDYQDKNRSSISHKR